MYSMQIWLLTKGAESHVLPLCQSSSSNLNSATLRHIDDFAKTGLRTLAVARKRLSPEEYSNFNNGRYLLIIYTLHFNYIIYIQKLLWPITL